MAELAAVIPLVIWLIIIGVICAIIYWAVNSIGLPPPFKMVIFALLAIVILLFLARVLTGVVPWRL